MNYELAKKLKDAGFPQRFVDGRKASVNKTNSEYCFEPILSELIEECGSYFNSLTRSYDSNTWEAKNNEGFIAKELTPEEAVANLWLKCNKKIDEISEYVKRENQKEIEYTLNEFHNNPIELAEEIIRLESNLLDANEQIDLL